MSDRDDPRANVLHAVIEIRDLLEPWLPEYALKRRDKREPGRREKEEAEDALLLWVMRHFRRQAKRIKERVQFAKAVYLDDIFQEMDEEEVAQLIRLLLKNARHGITLFGATTALAIDYTMTNLEAANWARRYAGKLIKDIDAYSLEATRRAVTQFIETPGFTMGDLVDLLPFSERRANMVAVTEVTRSYAEGQMMAGREMREQFPDVRVVKKWYTNEDDRVCDICGPLGDGDWIPIDEGFGVEEGEAGLMEPPAHPNCRCWISTSTALAELD